MLPEQEESAQGTVGFGVYLQYFKAGTGIIKFCLLVLVNLAAQFFYVGSDWWLSQWYVGKYIDKVVYSREVW